MTSAADAFAHAFIAALVQYIFIVLYGFICIRFCFTVAVAIMAFGGFGFVGLNNFSIIMRHSV